MNNPSNPSLARTRRIFRGTVLDPRVRDLIRLSAHGALVLDALNYGDVRFYRNQEIGLRFDSTELLLTPRDSVLLSTADNCYVLALDGQAQVGVSRSAVRAIRQEIQARAQVARLQRQYAGRGVFC